MKIQPTILALTLCGGLALIPVMEVMAQRGGRGGGGGGGRPGGAGGGGAAAGGRNAGHNGGGHAGGAPQQHGGASPAMSRPPQGGAGNRPNAGAQPGGRGGAPGAGAQRPGGNTAPNRPGQGPGTKEGAPVAGRPGADNRPNTGANRPGQGPGQGAGQREPGRRPNAMEDFVGGNNAVADRGRPGSRPGAENRPGADQRPGTDTRPGADNRPGINSRPGADNRPGLNNRPGNDNRPNIANNNRPNINNRPGGNTNIGKGGDTNINVGDVNVGNHVNYADNRQTWVNNQHNNGNQVRANTGNRYWGAYNNPGFRGGAVGGYPYYGGAAWGAAGSGWQAATWAGVGAFMGASVANAQPVYYAYGTGGNVYYENNTVYVDGQAAGTPQEYAAQAQSMVAAAPATDAVQDQQWMPLGVFAVTREGVPDSQQMLELAVSNQGVIGGTLYNEASKTSRPVKGTADPKSQRAAIGFADGNNADVVFETGLYNLTQDEAPGLVHFGADQSQPIVLVRLQKPDGQ